MLALIASLASAGMSIHQGTKGSPKSPSAIRKLNSREKRLFQRTAGMSVEEYQKARAGALDSEGRVNQGEIKRKLASMNKYERMARLREISNPDTMIGSLHLIASTQSAAQKASVAGEAAGARKVDSDRISSLTQSNVSAADALRRGYSIQSAQDRYTDQLNKTNRQTLMGQGIGSAISSLGNYYVQQKYLNQTQPNQQQGQQAPQATSPVIKTPDDQQHMTY